MEQRLLGIPNSSIEKATRRSPNTKIEKSLGHSGGNKVKLTPISDFPRMIAGLMRMQSYHSYVTHPWAAEVDTSRDFEVTAPSGATFIYEYPRDNVIFRFLKKVAHRR